VKFFCSCQELLFRSPSKLRALPESVHSWLWLDAEKVHQRRSRIAPKDRETGGVKCETRGSTSKLRLCLGQGASRRARVGRVRSLALLSILMFLEPSPRLSNFNGVVCVDRVFPQPAEMGFHIFI
jgi:hypothetical protein